MERSHMPDKKKVLFLCTGNSCRSQMTEGLARHFRGDFVEAYSAGTAPGTLNENAVRVMKELGIDISSHHSKRVEDLGNINFDYVVTVCGDANENCPVWLGRGKVVHRGFDDPPRLAVGARSEEEKWGHYRRVGDEIRKWIQTLPESLTAETV
jgi:arsenate reductase (thioredoxin)